MCHYCLLEFFQILLQVSDVDWKRNQLCNSVISTVFEALHLNILSVVLQNQSLYWKQVYKFLFVTSCESASKRIVAVPLK